MRWAEPGWLCLLVLVAWPWLVEARRPRLAWPALALFPVPTGRRAAFKGWLGPALGSAALACLVVALARPQSVAGRTRVAARGVAIALILDRSSSMTTADGGGETRLEAARRTIDAFIAGRPDDLIGLVSFANYPDLACPPTLDHATLRAALAGVGPARPGDDGTNIGDAIAWALDALRRTTPRRKVLVLLTDGANEPAVPDPLDPERAARLAHELGVTLHTVAVGAPGGIVRGVEATTGLPVPVRIRSEGPDLALLGRLADLGGGRTFRAGSPGDLAGIFATIDRLERSPVTGEIRTRYRERYAPWAVAGLLLLVVERALAGSGWGRLP